MMMRASARQENDNRRCRQCVFEHGRRSSRVTVCARRSTSSAHQTLCMCDGGEGWEAATIPSNELKAQQEMTETERQQLECDECISIDASIVIRSEGDRSRQVSRYMHSSYNVYDCKRLLCSTCMQHVFSSYQGAICVLVFGKPNRMVSTPPAFPG